MITYALDYETYYDKHCSIKTLGPLGYFSHYDFDAYMVSVVGDDGYQFVGHPEDFDWSLLEGQTVLSHNASFDETLYLFGIKQKWWPKVNYAAWYCTADMAAACGLPRSLKGATAAAYNLEVEKTTRDNMSGKTWTNMTEEFRKEVIEYALKDSELCLKLWQDYSPKWSEFERSISNLNRKIVQRGIPIDVEALKESREIINAKLYEAEQAIPWAGEKPLLSRKAFDEECIRIGIEPPASLSQTDVDAQEWIRKHGASYKWIESVSNWRRINSIKKKLDSFDYAIMPDDRYYGGLMYFGGHTGRFSGSGGNLNLQNLPRDEMFGVNMRNLITAAKGRKLVVVDLSQIEVRTLCWLAEDMETMKAIEASDDIYEAFAIQFGLWSKDKGALKKEDPKLRHKVKALVLGCFGPETKVWTQRGWVNIVDVRDSDTVWDGNQWVNHEGLLHQGIQETVTAHGLEATPDHEILTEHGWQEWSKVLQSEKGLKSALSTATLPHSATTKDQSKIFKKESTILRRKSSVYDLKNCGPNNRFTVLTDLGPVLVHNCGYGAGANRFAQMYNMPLKEAEEAVQLYRDKLKKVPALWKSFNDNLAHLYEMSFSTELKENENFKFKINLPSGRSLDYGFIQNQPKNNRDQLGALVTRNGKKRFMRLWGGVLAENASQALARDIFSHMMLEIDKAGIDIIFHVHDEVVCECDEDKAEETLNKIIEIMSTPPDWIPNIALDAEGEILTKYTK